LFKRGLALTIARPDGDDYFAQQPNGIRVTGLRVTFSIDSSLRREPNTAEIQVYNLAEELRAEFTRKPLVVMLDVGYDGALDRLFTGDLVHGFSDRDGPSWVTHLQVATGARAYARARVSRSFAGGVDAATAVAEVARSVGLEARLSVKAREELRRQYASGLVLAGAARDRLSELLAPSGMAWSIQENELVILRPDEDRGGGLLRIATDTGMVGAPTWGPPEKDGGDPVLTVAAKIKPTARPGEVILVESSVVTGKFRAERVRQEGDTHAEVWQTTWEAKSVP
jgi:hypothetical protein